MLAALQDKQCFQMLQIVQYEVVHLKQAGGEALQE